MTDKALLKMPGRRYLAVHLPYLPAERIAITAITQNRAPPDGPYALVEKAKSALRIAALDPQAQALGLEPGLTLADARARTPELAVFNHDPAADAALLTWLANACDRYTPSVAPDPPLGLILDIAGCLHGFGAREAALAADLRTRLRRMGLTPRLATANTPDAAAALAQFGGSNVRALPVAALRIDADTHLALRRAGLKTIGALADRPRAPLAARFGKHLPHLLARLLGEEDRHITPRRTPEEVSAEARFAEPIARTEDALATLTHLTVEAATRLNERGHGGRRFEAALFRSDGHVARLAVETAAPTRDPAVLDRLFRERIDALADPLDPGFGYDLIRLTVPVAEPLAPDQLALEGGQVGSGELAQLLDRLGTRLGKGRIRRFASNDTHIPEQAAFELPVSEPAPLNIWATAGPGEPPARPLHLFDPPQRIDVMAQVPDGPPRRFRWRRTQHDITRFEGPERIAAEWWRRKDGAGLTRDYYRVEDARGRRFWVFRHGLYGAEKANPDWYLHGVFA